MEFDYRRETRNGFVVTEQRKKIWAVELDILQRLLELCQKHNLRCWLDSGSLLGAIRHHGFIPWDDDIDVVMMRNDYDILMEIGPKEFKYPLFFQSAYTDKNYFRGHVQIRNAETTAIIPYEYDRGFNQGIFIDVFPLDAVPENDDKYTELEEQSHHMLSLMQSYHHLDVLGIKQWLNNIKNWYKSKKEIDKVGFVSYYRAYEELFRKYSVTESPLLTKLSAFKTKYKGIDRTFFDETLFVDFENIKVPVPKEYDSYLKLMFGDNYMIPLQVSTLHGGLFFDTEHSYKYYLPSHRWRFILMILKMKLRKLLRM
jgi:lipopolysaccharide cholinephosphotransferase